MRMIQNLVIIPVLAQILLTLVILALLPGARGRSMRERRQQMQDMALAGKTDWNEQAQKIAASFSSQFELPVLFYVVAAFALITRHVDIWLFGLACLFVLARIAHAIIHIGPNIVAWRFAAYAIGLASLVAMVLRLGWAVVATGF
jgi:hypothetical protein